MTKEKLGIVSSYDTLCGNASYTKSLVESLSKYYDVSVVSLNVDLLRKGNSSQSRSYLKTLCEQLKTYDCVNIQFEAGLFGSEPKNVLANFFPIAKACKKLVLTMHRFHSAEKYPSFKRTIKNILNGKISGLSKDFQSVYSNNLYHYVYLKIVKFCKKIKAPIIVHTPRERELIKINSKYDLVYDHPLCFFNPSYYETIKANHEKNQFYARYGLKENITYISIFGFINDYKGHITLINALQYLPENYQLLIFGSQHPLSIRLYQPIDSYLEKLINLIEKKKLSNRVKFFGNLNDEDFIKALIHSDFNILPYLEVSQGGSAIAALSLESGAKTIFSQNLAFLELAKYAPDSFKMFSIGNYHELAHAILSYNQKEYLENLKAYQNKYNAATNAAFYHKFLSKSEGVL